MSSRHANRWERLLSVQSITGAVLSRGGALVAAHPPRPGVTHLSEALGGELSLANRANGGARITITLPRVQASSTTSV